jgi:hypothetical protein
LSQLTFEHFWFRLLAQTLSVATILFCVVLSVTGATELTKMSPEFAEQMCVSTLSISWFFIPLFAWVSCAVIVFRCSWQRGKIPTKTLLLFAAVPVLVPLLNDVLGVGCEVGYVPSGPIIDVMGMFVAVPIGVALLLAAVPSFLSDVDTK